MSGKRELVGVSRRALLAALLVSALVSSVVTALILGGFVMLQKPSVSPLTEYDSGWLNLTDRAGRFFSVVHDLNSTNIVVDIVGKANVDDLSQQSHSSGMNRMPGWNRIYGNGYVSSIVQTEDDGFVLAGSGSTYSSNFVRVDAWGNLLREVDYGINNGGVIEAVIKTVDNGFALVGSRSWFSPDGSLLQGMLVIKTDSNGNVQWNRTYGGSDTEWGNSLIQAGDGGFVIAGDTKSFGAGSYDAWLVKTDSQGIVQWNKTYGGTDLDSAQSVIQTSDGGYALGGLTFSFGKGLRDFWLIKTDSEGNMQWNKTYGGSEDDIELCMIGTLDSGFLMSGTTRSFGVSGYVFWLVKADARGSMDWNQTYGGKYSGEAESVVQTRDGGYAVAGSSWLLKTDAGGNVEWNKTFGGPKDVSALSVIQTDDGAYAVTGSTTSFGGEGTRGVHHYWLAKTDSEAGLVWYDVSPNVVALYRGVTDVFWNYVRVHIWKIKEAKIGPLVPLSGAETILLRKIEVLSLGSF